MLNVVSTFFDGLWIDVLFLGSLLVTLIGAKTSEG